MKLSARYSKLALIAATSLTICSCGTNTGSSAPQAPAPIPGAVSVVKNQLTRNGVPWIPHGFYQIAFEVPPTSPTFTDPTQPWWMIAQLNYTPQEYPEMIAVGADSVRLQIAQPGVDPQNPLYSASYIQEAIGAIKSARAAGLSVIVSDQDEAQTGETIPETYPNAATQRFWMQIAPSFAQDTGVVFELFNEPSPPATTANWQLWATAMNTTIATIRGLGAVNVVVADGLNSAQELTGAPALTDSLNLVVYGAHPYANSQFDQTTPSLDAKFGTFSMTNPVIVSEWVGGGFFCNANTATSVVTFLQYLQTHGVGLENGIWDWSTPHFRSARWNFPIPQFSSFVGPSGPLTCDTDGDGTGLTVNAWYQTGTPPMVPQ